MTYQQQQDEPGRPAGRVWKPPQPEQVSDAAKLKTAVVLVAIISGALVLVAFACAWGFRGVG